MLTKKAPLSTDYPTQIDHKVKVVVTLSGFRCILRRNVKSLKHTMKKYTLFFVALIVLGSVLVIAQTILSGTPQQMQLRPVAGKEFGGDFTLQAADKQIKLSDYAGKVVLLYFGYASCPDVCPTSLAMLGTGLKKLSDEEVAQVQGIFISVDPERDQGEKLQQYAQHFHPNFIGATSTIPELQKIARQYGAFFNKSDSESALGYLVDHTSKSYVIGKDGKLAHLLPHDMTVPEITDAVRKALEAE